MSEKDLEPDCKEEEYDDIDDIVVDWMEFGRKVPLSSVSHDILYKISRYFSPEDNYWKFLAIHLGVDDNQTLKEISGNAYVEREWHSLILLLYCAENCPLTFSDLLVVLHKQLMRKDVLQGLHDSGLVKAFINRGNQKQTPATVDQDDSKHLVAKCLELIRCRPSAPIVQGGAYALNRLCQVVMALPSMQADVEARQALQALQRRRKWEEAANNRQAAVSLAENDKGKENDDECGGVGDVPRPLPELKPKTDNRQKKFAVLLTYSSDAEHLVPELVRRFWDAGVGVISEHTLRGRGYFEANYISAWQSFFKQCHLVVPIISEQYLKDTKSPNTSFQSRGVRFVFDLYTRQYFSDGCINSKVRPLVVDNLRGRSLHGINPTLEIRWKLNSELENFMNIVICRKNSILAG